jgi:hypothetical protein
MLWPDPQRRGEIHFKVAKALSYRARITLIAGLLAAGFAVQFLGALWPGAALLFGATLLSLVRGYTNIPQKFAGTPEWRGADRKELEQVREISRRSQSWDRSLLDITCARGLSTLIGLGVVVGGVAVWLSDWLESAWLARAWLADCVVLILPHWFTGVRRILTNAPLVVKIEHLLAILDDWETLKRDGEVMSPQMEVATGKGGAMPKDAKLVLRIPAAGDDFLGLQVQVTLNNVQGTDYPYLYAVLVARPAFGLLKKPLPPAPAEIVAEPKQEQDVQIVVLRQRTTKTSGYHTKPKTCLAIFRHALAAARQVTAAARA